MSRPLSIQDRTTEVEIGDRASASLEAKEEALVETAASSNAAVYVGRDVELAKKSPSTNETTSKRSSVIDMWRKREDEAMISSVNGKLPTTPRRSFGKSTPQNKNSKVVAGAVPSYNFEEKKETSFEEEIESKDKASGADVYHGFGKTNAEIVGQSETVNAAAGTLGATSIDAIPSERPPSRSNSYTRPKGSSVLDRWNNREQIQTHSNNSSPHRPPSPAVSADGPPLPTGGTPDSPAFKDLKSRWAKFGGGGSMNESGPIPSPVTPRKAAQSPSPRTSMEKKWQQSRQAFRQSPVSFNGESSVGEGRHTAVEKPMSTSSLQQPTLEVDNDGYPRNEGSVMPRKDQLKRMGQMHAAKSKQTSATTKACTYLYSKPGNSQTPAPQQETKAVQSASTPKSTFVAGRPSPRKFAQRKQLLEKHRRKQTVEEEEPSKINSGAKLDRSDAGKGVDALSQAFQDVVTEEEQKKLSDRLSRPQSRPQARPAFPRVSAQTLASYAGGGDDTSFESGKHLGGYSEYRSLHVSDSTSFNASELSKKLNYKDGGNCPGDDDYQSNASTSIASRSSIASRAHQTLRDKRKKNRDTFGTPVPTSDDNIQSSRQFSSRPTPGYASFVPNPSVDSGEDFPQDENATNASPSATREGTTKKKPSGKTATVRDATFDSDIMSTASNCILTVKSDGFKSSALTAAPEEIISDRFVSESNTNVEAFASSLQSMSLGQLANDLTEEVASTVFQGVDLSKLSSDLNQGMSAASESISSNMSIASASLNKLVGTNMFGVKQKKTTIRSPSPVEEVAIEVEYVED